MKSLSILKHLKIDLVPLINMLGYKVNKSLGQVKLCMYMAHLNNFTKYIFICLITYLVPPQKNTLNSNATMPVLAGSEQTLTCTTESSNPVSVMVWRKRDTEVTSGVRNQMSDGEYGGEVLQSTYTFIAQKSDYGLLVTCTPMWEGNEYTEYRQGVSLNVRCKLLLTHDAIYKMFKTKYLV